MSSFLKSLVDFTEPTGLLWLVLSILLVVHLRHHQWRMLWLSGTGWLVLTVTSALPVPHLLLASLENDWPPVELAALPECDAIVVLGGGMEPSVAEPHGLHLATGADRLFTALALARAGKAPLMVVGGGVFPTLDGRRLFEADSVRDWAMASGMASVPVQSLGGCADTHDEAMKTAALAREHGWKRVALVTSAFHMTRSKAVFEKAGVVVVPVPCNYLSAPMRGRPLPWFNVPNAAYLQHFEAWMHEAVGMVAYRLRGWV